MVRNTRTKLLTILAVVFVLGTFIYIKRYHHEESLFLPSGVAVSRIKFLQHVLAAARNNEDRKETARQEYVKTAFDASERLYKSFVETRRKLVGRNPEKVDPWNGVFFWEYFLPTFACPYSTQRIGRLGDGGKWTCGFELFEKDASKEKTSTSFQKSSRPCIVYSFGVSGESSFEAEFLERTDCEIFAYDASVDKPGPQVAANDPRFHFHKMYIDDDNTLASMMKENNHTWIDFLKMDVEGAEFRVLDQIMDDFKILPFGHFNVEIHTDGRGWLFPTVYRLWERLEWGGLRPFKSEMNHHPCVISKIRPILVEYSFINIYGEGRLLPP